MALANKSLILCNYQVTVFIASIDVVGASGGPTLMATVRLGFYSLSDILSEIVRAMNAADPANAYSATGNRTVAGGFQNLVTISTSGSFLSLLFGSGPRNGSSIAALIGFAAIDRTGATSYLGNTTTGTNLQPTLIGYNFLSPEFYQKVFGSVNVSASGLKEAIVFNLQQFLQVQFKYESKAFWIS